MIIVEDSIVSLLRQREFQQQGVAHVKCYGADEILIEEGSSGRTLYLVLSGVVRVSSRVRLQDERGIRPGLCDLHAGDVFGELSLFEASPRSATVTALEACELLEFDGEALEAFMTSNPEQGYALLRGLYAIIADRLRKADQRMGSLFAWGLKAHGIAEHF